MRKHKRSIIWRITAYLMGFVVLLLMVLWLLQTVLLPVLYTNHRSSAVVAAVQEIGSSIGKPYFYKQTSQIAREQSACVRVLRMSGTEIFSVEYMPYCDLHSLSKEELMVLWQKAKDNGGYYTSIYPMDSPRLQKLVPSGVNAIIYVKIFNVLGQPSTAVFFNSTITPIDGMIQVLKLQLIWLTVIALFLAFCLTIFVSLRTARPITRLNEQARQLGNQNFDVVFEGGGYREVEELSSTLNRARNEMEQLEGLRRELIAKVSHDLRTPMSMIIAYSEVMRDLPGENTPENIQVVIDEANRLSALVNDVLLHPLSVGPAQNLNFAFYDIAMSVKATLARYQKLSESQRYKIKYEGPDNAIVYADKSKISQAIYNLLNNAMSHAGKNREIVLRIKLLDCMVRIEVSDSGEGIPEDKIPLIWERYYSDTNDNSFHVGLGLTIVREILELHRVRYGVESKIGAGSTFWFYLKGSNSEGDAHDETSG